MTQCRIETAYSAAYAAAQEADAITDNMILYLKNKSGSSALQDASTLIAAAKRTKNHFVVDSDYDVLVNNLNRLKATLKTEIKKVDFTESIAVLTNISAIVKRLLPGSVLIPLPLATISPTATSRSPIWRPASLMR